MKKGGEIQSDESKRREWAQEFDAVIETCKEKTRANMYAAINKENPYMFRMDRRDWFYECRNEVAFNRINLAIRKAHPHPFQTSLI